MTEVLEGLQRTLATFCTRVYLDPAPAGTASPYITVTIDSNRRVRWLGAGNAAGRELIVTIGVWSDSRSVQEAMELHDRIEAGIEGNPAAFDFTSQGCVLCVAFSGPTTRRVQSRWAVESQWRLQTSY